MNFIPKANVRFVKKLLCGTSLGALATVLAGQAQAQVQAPATEEVTVTATGTSIKGIAPAGTNLITVDASTIKATGAITTDEILNQIPQIANTFNTQTVSPTAINIGGVRPSIRFNPAQNIVGGSATLLLLDGHNLVGVSGLATAPDAGVIPTIVLRQVDVLPDGASSIYGADAINGVINFVTRDTYQGFQANASVGVADGYSSFNASMMAGTDWGTGGAYMAFEHKDNTYLFARDRSYTKMDLTGIGGRDSRGTACDLANITAPGGKNYALTSSTVPNTPGALAANSTGPFAGLNAQTNAGSFNRCDTNSYSSLYPREEQNSFFGQFHQHIMNGVEFSTKFLWSTRLDSAVVPELSATSTIDTTNPYFQSINGETTQTVQFAFGPYFGNQGYTNYNNIQVFQVTPKLTVDLPIGDWQATAILNYGRSNTTGFQRTANTALLNLAMRQQVIAGVLSPALVASPSLSGNAVDPYNLTAGNPTVITELLITDSSARPSSIRSSGVSRRTEPCSNCPAARSRRPSAASMRLTIMSPIGTPTGRSARTLALRRPVHRWRSPGRTALPSRALANSISRLSARIMNCPSCTHSPLTCRAASTVTATSATRPITSWASLTNRSRP